MYDDDEEYGSYPGYSHPGHGHGRGHGQDNAHDFAKQAFRTSADAMKNADLDKPVNVFGFEVDAGLAAWVAGIYNSAAHYASNFASKNAYKLTAEHLPKLLPDLAKTTNATTLHKAGVGAMLVSDFAIRAGGYVYTIGTALHEQQQKRQDMVRKLAPVLDDMKGKHSMGAFMSINASQNEMIYAHRKWMAKHDNIDNFGNVITLILNAGPGMVMGYLTEFKPMLGAKDYAGVQDIQRKAHEARVAQNGHGMSGGANDFVALFVNNSSSQLSERLKRSGQHQKTKRLQPYTALQMVLTLQDQIEHNPKARSYQVPGQRGESYPLEEYLVRILIQHQKDMADVSPEHTPLREALQEDLNEVVQPLAKAIRHGDLSAIALVRLVGEGKIIKGKGRAIADADEVAELIEKTAGKSQTYVHIDPKEYYATASFTKEELKAMLGKLEKDEKQLVASWIPDDVLKEAGMHADEIKHLREQPVKDYEKALAETFSGLAAMSDEELKKDGFANSEIKHLRKAQQQLQQGGMDAVHELKTGPANEKGIERALANYVVSHPSHLGKLVNDGKKELTNIVDAAANEDGEGARHAPKKFASKAKQHVMEDMANDNEAEAANDTHTQRERGRRSARMHGADHDEREF